VAFEAYEQVARDEFLALPIGGKTYVIPPVGAKDGIRLQVVTDEVTDQLEDPQAAVSAAEKVMTNEEFYRIMLSAPVLEQMRADNVPEQAIARAVLTAIADHQNGRAVAEIIWKTGGLPERLAAYTAASGSARKRTTRTGGVSTTRSRASGTTTRSRKATSKAASRSRGGAS